MLIDTHCHLYLEDFELDIDEVVSRAKISGVERFYLPAVDSSTTSAMLELEAKYPDKFLLMMGLHPCSVKDNYKKELELVNDWLSKRRFAAIGEIGLDFFWDKTFIKEQYEVFEKQIELAIAYELPIVIHTRNAMQETIDIVKKYKTQVKGIFHCFGGTLEEANQIIDLGFYLGIGGVVTYKKSGLADVIKQIDIRHLVLETDAPYLTPVPFRGKRNESSYLTYISEKIAEVKEMTLEEVAGITTANALKIFPY